MTENIDNLIIAFITASVALISMHLSNLAHNKRDKEKFNRNEKQKKNDLHRIKLEELYMFFYNWESYLNSFYMSFIPAIQGTITKEDAWKITQENKLSKEDSHRMIIMIVHIYFPQLTNELSKVLELRDELSTFLGKNMPKDGNTKEFLLAHSSFNKAAKEFKDKIAEISNAL